MSPSSLLLKFLPVAVLLAASAARSADPGGGRPALLFREDWRETPAATPVTQEHVSHPDLILTRHGPAEAQIRKSHHDQPADDPYYIWSGAAEANWAISLRHATSLLDLSGQARIRWRARQSGFRQLRIVLKVAGGGWLVGDHYDGESSDWRICEFNLADLRWRALNIEKVTEGGWVANPDLSRVEEIGCTDLMAGGRTGASSRLDWIEVYGRAVPREAALAGSAVYRGGGRLGRERPAHGLPADHAFRFAAPHGAQGVRGSPWPGDS